jgi:predicted GNAT family acetyltransferase
MPPSEVEIRDNPAERRFEAWVDGGLAGIAEYEPAEGRLVFVHTEVFAGFEGRGIGSRLAAWALDDVRGRGLRATPLCPFIAGWIRAHPEYRDLVVGVRGTQVPRRGGNAEGG